MKLKSLTKLMIAVMALSLGVFFACGKAGKGEKVVVKGSTTVLPITQKAIEAYAKVKKDVSISVDGSGSGNGIKALLDGTTDIAQASRAMKDKEFKKAKETGVEVKEIVVAYDMIVPVVHPSNGITNITMDQLLGIYEGKIKNWKELGGKDENIVVMSRDTSSGTYEFWNEAVLKKKDVRKDALLQASNGAVVSAVAGNPKSIGYIGFGYLNESVKVLQVNGIEPTIENGKIKKYPVSRELYMYANEKKFSDAAKGFIDFILGDEGQKLVKEAGFIPLK